MSLESVMPKYLSWNQNLGCFLTWGVLRLNVGTLHFYVWASWGLLSGEVHVMRSVPQQNQTSLMTKLFSPWRLCLVENKPVKRSSEPAFLYRIELTSLLPPSLLGFLCWQNRKRLVERTKLGSSPIWSCQMVGNRPTELFTVQYGSDHFVF